MSAVHQKNFNCRTAFCYICLWNCVRLKFHRENCWKTRFWHKTFHLISLGFVFFNWSVATFYSEPAPLASVGSWDRKIPELGFLSYLVIFCISVFSCWAQSVRRHTASWRGRWRRQEAPEQQLKHQLHSSVMFTTTDVLYLWFHTDTLCRNTFACLVNLQKVFKSPLHEEYKTSIIDLFLLNSEVCWCCQASSIQQKNKNMWKCV